jgi:hypothetical protein
MWPPASRDLKEFQLFFYISSTRLWFYLLFEDTQKTSIENSYLELDARGGHVAISYYYFNMSW